MATLLFHPHQYLINKLGFEVKREIGTVEQDGAESCPATGDH